MNQEQSPQPPHASLPVPDYCEPIIAYRAWTIDVRKERLKSYCKPSEWPVYERLVSTHVPRSRFDVTGAHSFENPCTGPLCEEHTHDRPGCGIYGFKAKGQLGTATEYDARSSYVNFRPPVVYGEVYLWGHVFEHEKGYRAQYAYPKKFFASSSSELTTKLADAYGVSYEEDAQWKSAYLSDDSSPSLWSLRSPQDYLNLYYLNYLYSFPSPNWSPQPRPVARKTNQLRQSLFPSNVKSLYMDMAATEQKLYDKMDKMIEHLSGKTNKP